jgi:hypothetical protein
MGISYKASEGCVSLDSYFTRAQKVTDTSKESLKNHKDRFSQVRLVEGLLKSAPAGLTDFELKRCMDSAGVSLPLSSISARRNDVNQLYKEQRGLIVVNVNKESRVNPKTGKKNLVWRYLRK